MRTSQMWHQLESQDGQKLIGLGQELKYTSCKQKPHADALSKKEFDEDQSYSDQACLARNNSFSAQRVLVTHEEIKKTRIKQNNPRRNETNPNRLLKTILCINYLHNKTIPWPYTMESS